MTEPSSAHVTWHHVEAVLARGTPSPGTPCQCPDDGDVAKQIVVDQTVEYQIVSKIESLMAWKSGYDLLWN